MLKTLLAFTLLAPLALAGCGGEVTGPSGADENGDTAFNPDSALMTGGDAVVANTGGSGLNLRTGASRTNAVILVMPEGATVKVLAGPSNGYFKVSYNGHQGWGFGGYLRGVAPPVGPHPGGGVYPPTLWHPASSSNYTGGRSGSTIRFVVIHDMEGSYQSAISWFENPAAQASAHYSIRSSDGQITQQVREGDIAWHAGNWSINEQSIGIEHEGFLSDPGRWYTATMYEQSAKLTAAICHRYGIPVDRAHIFGHDEVPDPNHPGQFGGVDHHRDPGPGWNWTHYLALVKSYL